jgi:hypothetical protein
MTMHILKLFPPLLHAVIIITIIIDKFCTSGKFGVHRGTDEFDIGSTRQRFIPPIYICRFPIICIVRNLKFPIVNISRLENRQTSIQPKLTCRYLRTGIPPPLTPGSLVTSDGQTFFYDTLMIQMLPS